jgi:hypothetical protein
MYGLQHRLAYMLERGLDTGRAVAQRYVLHGGHGRSAGKRGLGRQHELAKSAQHTGRKMDRISG